MALGLRTVADDSIDNVNLEEGFPFRFFPESMSSEAIADIRTNFGEWVLGNALKELDQNCSLFLDAIKEILTLTGYAGRPIEQEALDGIAYFRDQSSVAVKLDMLKRDHGVRVPVARSSCWTQQGKERLVSQSRPREASVN